MSIEASSVKFLKKGENMFIEEIRFPEDFEAKEIKEDGYYIIIGIENLKWEVRGVSIAIIIKDYGTGCDTTICVGEEVEKVYGDEKEVMERINYHVCNFFRGKAKEKGLYYRY